uniref:Uncharacterized protein n=1 Tax=Anguilla anguilla TaxID=7936 RepID=A0A0E9WTQ3_ANGAN
MQIGSSMQHLPLPDKRRFPTRFVMFASLGTGRGLVSIFTYQNCVILSSSDVNLGHWLAASPVSEF